MIKGLPRTERPMAVALSMLADPQTIEEAFASNQMLTIASDGGLKGTQATFRWVLAKKPKLLCQRSGPVDGHRDTTSSTRSELWGLALSLLSLALVSRAWKCIYRCKFQWLVDSEADIARVRKFLKWGRLKRGPQPPDIGVISIIWKYYKELGKKLKITWIKAHQDDTVEADKLSESAKFKQITLQLPTARRVGFNPVNWLTIKTTNESPSS